MTAPTLTEFLLARIAEDEGGAQAALNGGNGVWESGADNYNECRIEGGHIIIYDEGGHTPEQARHIARHDPARVLAECEAKRRIMEAFEDERQRKDIYNRDYPLGLLTTEGDLRARLSSNARWAGLEIAVRALAAVYTDHPDYDEDWRA